MGRNVLPKCNFHAATRTPWMVRDKSVGEPASWEVSFNRAGVPLKIQASAKPVAEPELSYLKPGSVDGGTLTMDRITGRGANARLTEKGKQFMRLLVFPD